MENERDIILEKMKENKYIVFDIQGGHGKGIMATAVVRALKKKYPDYKIIITTAWDAPWFFNQNVHQFHLFGQMPYFYDNFMFDDTKIFRIDPYHTEDHIQQRKHLTQTWCDLYDIPYDGQLPEITLNPREIEIAKDKIKPDGRPIMLIQTHGGMPSNQYSKKSWARDIPMEVAQSVVNYFAKSYRILHIRLPEQPALQNVEPLSLPLRELYGVFTLSSKRLFMDSFSQHVAAALGLPSTVCWIANNPKVFGYEMHNNITPDAEVVRELNKFSYLEKHDITGQVQQFPYDTVNVFDVKNIIEAVRNT